MPYQDQAVGKNRPEKAQAEAEIKNTPSFLSFPAKPHPHSMLMVFKKYAFENYEAGNYSSPLRAAVGSNRRTTGQELRSTDSVELPFPTQLSDSTGLNINGYSRDPLVEKGAQKINEFINSGGQGTLGDIPGAIQKAGVGLASMLSGASGSGGGGAFSAAQDLYAGLTGTSTADAAQGAKYLLRSLASGSIGQAIDTATGQTLNPKETLAFEGVQLRTHQFTWELYPSNQKDSENIKKIISTIKRNSLPSTADFGGISNAFLNFPSVVELHLIGVNRDYYPSFKPAMITSVSVDYQAGGNVAIMRGGKPAGVTLNIALTELEIQTADDMNLGDSTTYADSNGEFMGP